MSELVKAILKITNESPYGWLDIDSVEAKKIELLIMEFKTKEKSGFICAKKCTEQCGWCEGHY